CGDVFHRLVGDPRQVARSGHWTPLNRRVPRKQKTRSSPSLTQRLGTEAGLRGTTRVPGDLRRTLTTSAIGLDPDALFCASAPERILSSFSVARSQSCRAIPVRGLRGTALRRSLMRSLWSACPSRDRRTAGTPWGRAPRCP